MRAILDVPARWISVSPIIRFLLTGGVNTVFGYTIYLLGLAARLAPELALLLATGVGALFNYMTTSRLVFRHRTLSRFVPFIGTYALIYLVNAAAIRLLLSGGLAPAVAQAVLVPVMAVLSFFLFRFIVFGPVQRS